MNNITGVTKYIVYENYANQTDEKGFLLIPLKLASLSYSVETIFLNSAIILCAVCNDTLNCC